MGSNVFVTGSGNRIEGADNFAAINCHDQEYTSEHSNKTVFNNGAIVIGEDEVTMTLPVVETENTETKSIPFTVEKNIKHYFIDASGGTIDVSLVNDGVEHTFTKIDGSANNIVLVPDTGTINGDVGHTFNTQYQRKQPLFDGTNYYV